MSPERNSDSSQRKIRARLRARPYAAMVETAVEIATAPAVTASELVK